MSVWGKYSLALTCLCSCSEFTFQVLSLLSNTGTLFRVCAVGQLLPGHGWAGDTREYSQPLPQCLTQLLGSKAHPSCKVRCLVQSPWPGLQLMGLCSNEHMLSRGYCESHHPESGSVKASCISEWVHVLLRSTIFNTWSVHATTPFLFNIHQVLLYYIYLVIHLSVYLLLFAYLQTYIPEFHYMWFQNVSISRYASPLVRQHFVWPDNCLWGVSESCGRRGEGVAAPMVRQPTS